MRSHYCGQVNSASVGREVTVAGWVHRRRDHGGVIFIDLRDREGLLQVVFDPDRAEMFKDAERLRSRAEASTGVTPSMRRRPCGSVTRCSSSPLAWATWLSSTRTFWITSSARPSC